MSKKIFESIKAFGMTNQMISEDLSRIGEVYGFEFGHLPQSNKAVEDVYYTQFDSTIRDEAAKMAKHYEIFYSLEKSIRALVYQKSLRKQKGHHLGGLLHEFPKIFKMKLRLVFKKNLMPELLNVL